MVTKKKVVGAVPVCAPKLVRDYIPDLMREAGLSPEVEVLKDDRRFLAALNDKLFEEVAEYKEGLDEEELADVIEVVEEIVALLERVSPGRLERVRAHKRSRKGGFTARQYLKRA